MKSAVRFVSALSLLVVCALMIGACAAFLLPTEEVCYADAIRTAVRLYAAATHTRAPSGTASFEDHLTFAEGKDMAVDTEKAPDDTVSRAEAVRLLYSAMPSASYAVINDQREVPGVRFGEAGYAEILAFYRAGVLTGVDESGAFDPEGKLTNAELQTMYERLLHPERRVKYEKKQLGRPKQAYLLCFTDDMDNAKEGIESGWEYDNRAGRPKTTLSGNATLYDIMSDERSRLVRYFNEIENDTLEMFVDVSFSSPFDGSTLEFCDEDDSLTYRLVLRGGCFCLENADGTYTELYDAHGKTGTYRFRIILDLYDGVAETVINNISCGVYPLLGRRVRYFALCTGVEEHNTATLKNCFIYANYAEYEDFNHVDALPYDLTVTGEPYLADLTRSSVGVNCNDNIVILPKDSAIKSDFSPMSGSVVFTVNTHLQNGSSGAYYSLLGGENEVVRVYTEDGKLYANGVYLRDFDDRLWHKLRVEADTVNRTALIKTNAKVLGTVAFLADADAIDAAEIGNTGVEPSEIDDIRVRYAEEYDIPSPVKPQGEENYVVGMNVCSLWVNGEHWGWGCVSPYEDMRPVLGYYDEGLEETADWENKFLAEHGIDFQAFCWYANTRNAPLKTTRLAMQLDDAYLHSKYKSDVDFCILWEAANADYPRNSHDFREYYVPYFIENYFSDPSYACIDNKLVLSIFGATNLINTFGTSLKDEFDYMRGEVRKLVNPRTGEHYDGMIIMASHSHGNYAAYGFDGVQAYNWGTGGNSYSTNVNSNMNWFNSGDVVTVPSISVGFNSRPWHGVRYPLISLAEYKMAHEWVRDTFLPNYARKDGVTWNDNFVWLSTWNEYGEGTYIMPAEKLHGFGYIDTIREVYCDGGTKHEDIVPNEEQLRRINHNYPQDKRLLRSNGTYSGAPGVYDDSPKEYDFTSGSAWSDVLLISQCVRHTGVDKDGAIFVTDANNPDAIMTFRSGVTDALYCNHVARITVTASGIPEGETMQLFFRSGSSDVLCEENSFKLESAGTEEQAYVFEVRQHENWGGRLNYLRLDPVNKTNVTFRIRSIRFDMVPCPEASPRVKVNGLMMANEIVGEMYDGVPFFPFEPGVSLINYYLYVYHTWDHDTGRLTLMRDGKKAVFTVGSDKAIVDGRPYPLGGAVYAVDQIPMLPIRDLCAIFGFRLVKYAGELYCITTPEEDLFVSGGGGDNPGISTADAWYFNRENDAQGWSAGNCSIRYGTGCAVITSSTSVDPIMYSPDNMQLPCEDYPKIEINCRWNITGQRPDAERETMGVYFITTGDTAWAENKHVLAEIQTASDGEFVKIVLDMTTCDRWKGTLRRIRFDPFDAYGTCEVKSIRFVNRNAPPEDDDDDDAPVKVEHGDAESEKHQFYAENGSLNIVTDPRCADNRVFRLTPDEGSAVLRHPFTFESGAAYDITFELLVAEGETAAAVLPYGNLTVTQTAADGWLGYTLTFTVPDGQPEDAIGLAVTGGEVFFDNITVVKRAA